MSTRKIYFDIGTNLFQGYEFFKSHLNINDEWIKIFIEPNPLFVTKENIDRIKNIPNSVFLPFALCDDAEEKIVDFYYIPSHKADVIDQGGRIYNPDKNATSTKVHIISIEDIVKPYLDHELYFKFDCEGAEFASLPKLLKMQANIKFISCEFHYLGTPNSEELINSMQNIRKMISDRNIQYLEWR